MCNPLVSSAFPNSLPGDNWNTWQTDLFDWLTYIWIGMGVVWPNWVAGLAAVLKLTGLAIFQWFVPEGSWLHYSGKNSINKTRLAKNIILWYGPGLAGNWLMAELQEWERGLAGLLWREHLGIHQGHKGFALSPYFQGRFTVQQPARQSQNEPRQGGHSQQATSNWTTMQQWFILN